MKKFVLVFLILLTSCVYCFAAENDWDIALIDQIDKVGEPYLKGDCVIFTADKNARHVGIAVDYENFKEIHSFYKKDLKDMDDNVTDSFYFYILELPKNVQTFRYRLVIDGLWTCDPQNKNTVFDGNANLYLSEFNAQREIPDVTEKTESGYVRFVYKGQSGQQVRLGGSFTNWDSWIYEMQEVEPGLYEFNLPLPPGTYEYAFYSGLKSFIDRTNPLRCYTADGKIASRIVVN